MKTAIHSTCLAFLLGIASVHAQNDAKISTGIVAFQQGDYTQALEQLDLGLNQVSELKSKNISKGYYYRGATYLRLLEQISTKVKNGIALEPTEKEIAADGIPKAFDDLSLVRDHDSKDKWSDKVAIEMEQVHRLSLQSGLSFLNGSYNSALSTFQKEQFLNEGVKYLAIATQSNPENYMGFDLLAQAQLGLSDSSAALSSFKKAAAILQNNPIHRQDLLVGYIFYRIALLERYTNKDTERALSAINDGKAALKMEWDKLAPTKNQYTDKQWRELEAQHESAQKDLNTFELDIYLNAPDKLQTAILKYDLAIKEDPTNYHQHLAYATLLEKTNNIEDAIIMYEKAIQIDSGKHQALFNLGALYFNEGVIYYRKAMDEAPEDAAGFQKQAEKYFRKAYPKLVKAQKIIPCDRETLKALQQIAINLAESDEKMNGAYQKYKTKQQECEGQ